MSTHGKRTRLYREARDTRGNMVASITVSLVRHARPTRFECRHVWDGKPPATVSGVFVRDLRRTVDADYEGVNDLLIELGRRLADRHGLRMYADTNAGDKATRAYFRENSGRESIFWFSPGGELMVRYLWM